MLNFTFALLKQESFDTESVPEIMNMIREDGFVFYEQERVNGRWPRHHGASFEHWAEHYQEHKGKDFFKSLVSRYEGSEFYAFVVFHEDPECIARFRKLIGNTDPTKAGENTIRGKFGFIDDNGNICNMIHASDSKEAVEREMRLWFNDETYGYEIKNADFIRKRAKKLGVCPVQLEKFFIQTGQEWNGWLKHGGICPKTGGTKVYQTNVSLTNDFHIRYPTAVMSTPEAEKVTESHNRERFSNLIRIAQALGYLTKS